MDYLVFAHSVALAGTRMPLDDEEGAVDLAAQGAEDFAAVGAEDLAAIAAEDWAACSASKDF